MECFLRIVYYTIQTMGGYDMSILTVIKINWHKLSRNYHLLMLEDCLDTEAKHKLRIKAEYHEKKINTYC